MHFINTEHSSSAEAGFSLVDIVVSLAIVSMLTASVCWICEQTTRGMILSAGRLNAELPHLVITSPDGGAELTDPARIHVAWSARSVDHQDDDDSLMYATLYSRNNGDTWRNMCDDTPARPGVRPADPHQLVSATSYNWSVPTDRFPEGSYIIRVEAYRDDTTQHYAFDQYRAFIKR